MHGRLKKIAKEAGVSLEAIERMPKIPCCEPREVIAPEAEFERLVRVAPPWLELLLLLAHEAGLRAMTAAKLTRANVDFDSGRITGKTKGGARYDVPMTKRLRDRLLWYCAAAQESSEPLSATFRVPRQQPNDQTIRSAMRAARARAGLSSRWGLHDLRRTAARALYERTRDIRKVQAFLGHKMLWTTCWYLGNGAIQLTGEDLEDSITTRKEGTYDND